MKRGIALTTPFLLVLACSSPAEPAKAVPPPSPDAQPIVDRFTHGIWPAVSAYNADHSQGGKAYQAFTFEIVAPGMNGEQYDNLRTAAQALGRMTEYDRDTQTIHGNDGLTIGTVDVRSIQDTTAALDVCYTYTHYWRNLDTSITQRAPEASEATFQLSDQGGTWLLRGITDDHVVSSCGANRA